MAQRLAAAREEMSHVTEFDYVIVNDDFAQATLELRAVFLAARLRRAQALARHADLVSALLAPGT